MIPLRNIHNFVLVLIFSSLPVIVHSETIYFEDGKIIQGQIGQFSDNIVKFYADRYYALDLRNISDAHADENAQGEVAPKQREKIEKLLFVIDCEKYLRRQFRRDIRRLVLERKFDQVERIAVELHPKLTL